MACIFCILKDLINSNLHKLAETPLSRCFSVCCGKNSLIALSDSFFAQNEYTLPFMRIFSENISFCFPNARNTCRRSRHRHTARRYAVFLQQSPKIPRQNALGASHFAYYMVRKHRQLSEKQLTDPRRPTH